MHKTLYNISRRGGGAGERGKWTFNSSIIFTTCMCQEVESARILSAGVHFFSKKVDDLFLVVTLKDRLNIPPNLSHSAKTVLKLTLTLAGGALRVLGGCTFTFFL